MSKPEAMRDRLNQARPAAERFIFPIRPRARGSAGIGFGQPLKRYAVIFAHRSLKRFAEPIVQDAPAPALNEG